MNTLQTVLAIMAGLVALAGVIGGLYAVFRSAERDARIKRLQDERDDYLSRLNYIEPKLVEAENEVKVMRSLHDSTAALEGLGEQHVDIIEKLDAHTVTLGKIERGVRGDLSP